jgi:hypothetical protein
MIHKINKTIIGRTEELLHKLLNVNCYRDAQSPLKINSPFPRSPHYRITAMVPSNIIYLNESNFEQIGHNEEALKRRIKLLKRKKE